MSAEAQCCTAKLTLRSRQTPTFARVTYGQTPAAGDTTSRLYSQVTGIQAVNWAPLDQESFAPILKGMVEPGHFRRVDRPATRNIVPARLVTKASCNTGRGVVAASRADGVRCHVVRYAVRWRRKRPTSVPPTPGRWLGPSDHELVGGLGRRTMNWLSVNDLTSWSVRQEVGVVGQICEPDKREVGSSTLPRLTPINVSPREYFNARGARHFCDPALHVVRCVVGRSENVAK